MTFSSPTACDAALAMTASRIERDVITYYEKGTSRGGASQIDIISAGDAETGVKRMRVVPWLVLALCIAALANSAAAQQRELGAHEHGRGTLNIVVEGTRVSMEFEAPGADIVGFEHAAKTQKQRAAVDQATKRLSVPQTLFKLPDSAACAVRQASVEVEGGEDGHDHAKDGAKKDGAEPEGKEHTEFHAKYAFECKSPANITAIEFDYFRAFAGAQKLDVNLVTSKGQSKFEVTRAKPRIDLAGMM